MIAGWGRYPRTEGTIIEADDANTARTLIASHPSLIPRGNGRAYGDAALSHSAMLTQTRADHILAFDPENAEIEVEAGAILADLLPFLLARGFFVPVTPGTAQVTIGGMAAADVHGKNHHGAGTFGRHIRALTMLLADGSQIRCTPDHELFWATIGGMGLTGVILTIRFRLIRVAGGMIRQTAIKTGDLAETLAASESSRTATYSVAWIDCLAGGRGVVFQGEHAPETTVPPVPRARAIPCDVPPFTLNRLSIAAFNQTYYHATRAGSALVDVWRFFYPLDALHGWNRLYGKRGLVQYQCVLPHEAGEAGLRLLLDEIARQGLGSFLVVLKLCGEEGNGLLSFPRPGFSLALDFPATAAIFALFERLDAITLDHGGRLYLAKDACAGPDSLRHYQRLDQFRALRDRYDPQHRFASLLSQRLGL